MSKFNVGQKVRITGKKTNFTMKIDGKIGTIVGGLDENGYYCVDVEGLPTIVSEGWYVEEDQITPIEGVEANAANAAEKEVKETKETRKSLGKAKSLELAFDMAEVTASFMHDIFEIADKHNIYRKEVLDSAIATLTRSSEDDFFWEVVVPAQEAVNALEENE